jgi:hypothetical protein
VTIRPSGRFGTRGPRTPFAYRSSPVAKGERPKHQAAPSASPSCPIRPEARNHDTVMVVVRQHDDDDSNRTHRRNVHNLPQRPRPRSLGGLRPMPGRTGGTLCAAAGCHGANMLLALSAAPPRPAGTWPRVLQAVSDTVCPAKAPYFAENGLPGVPDGDRPAGHPARGTSGGFTGVSRRFIIPAVTQSGLPRA